MRGRPPATRARVLNFIAAHHPETVMQIARSLQIDRSQVYRILRAVYGPNFRQRWHVSAKSAFTHISVPLAA